MVSADVAVLGAGPAGLMAALQAARAGREVVLLEAADRVGGMAGSFEVAGVRVDFGSHRLHPVVPPPVMAVLGDLLGGDLQPRTRRGRIALEGRWLRFPLQFGDLARNLPPSFLARTAVETLASPARRPTADNAAATVAARLGPTVADRFYLPYFRKLWDVPPEELSTEIADRRVSARGPADILRGMLGRGRSGPDYLYPRRGFGQISETLAEAAVTAGVDLRLGARVSALAPRDDGVRVALDDGAEVDAGATLSSIPVPLLARLAGAPAELLEAAGRLRHRAMVLVYLALDADRLTAFDAHYFPEPDTPVSRLSEPKNFRDSTADPPDRTVVCAEVPAWPGDETFTADADELAGRVIETLVPKGFDFPALLDVHVHRIAHCYPVYTGSYAADLAAIEEWVADQPNLLTFGRQGLFAPDNSHHAMLMGFEAAQMIRDGGGIDRAGWAAARERYREHVVED